MAKLSLKTLKYIALDFRNNIELIRLSTKWFGAMTKGAKSIIQAYMTLQDNIFQIFVECAESFVRNRQLMTYFYFESLLYFMSDIS